MSYRGHHVYKIFIDFRILLVSTACAQPTVFGDYNPACIMSFMRGLSHLLLLSSPLFILLSCTPETPQPPLQTSFYVYRFNPPAFIEFSTDFQPANEIPFSIPPNCGLFDVFPAPLGNYLAIELSCPTGQTVLFLNTGADSITQPVTESDSHFLAWT